MPMTIAEIGSLASRKFTRVIRFLKKRARIEKRVAALRARIAAINASISLALGGRAPAAAEPRKTRKTRTARAGKGRHRRGKPLSDYMTEILKSTSKPLKAAEIARRAVTAGFRTRSRHLSTAVFATAARKKDVFERVGRGLFALVRGSREPAAKA